MSEMHEAVAYMNLKSDREQKAMDEARKNAPKSSGNRRR